MVTTRDSRRRKGLTLPEVLVTLAIAATLAAVLLPALTSQLAKGDAGRLANDLVTMQTSIGTFTADVRRFPANLRQLNEQISTSVVSPQLHQDLLGQTYPQSLINRWRGPYLAKSLTTEFEIPTAFGADIKTNFVNEGGFVVVEFFPITLSDFEKVDLIIDEEVSSTTGQLRWVSANDGTGRFFAIPIQ